MHILCGLPPWILVLEAVAFLPRKRSLHCNSHASQKLIHEYATQGLQPGGGGMPCKQFIGRSNHHKCKRYGDEAVSSPGGGGIPCKLVAHA
eukprot:3441738-Amphidinium_carterae.1